MPSNLTELFGLILFFAFAALVIHSLWQASKRVRPATDRLPSGVDGALLWVAGLAFLAGIYDVAAAALAYQQLGAGATLAPDHAAAFDLTLQLGLNAVGAAAFFWASIRLFFGRRARVRTEATISLLLGGPVVEALSALLLPASLGIDWFSWYALLCVAVLFAIRVILKSEASRNTYGDR